ncbi:MULTISPECIES: hypothetical protein [Streptomyces]|uniref:Uncharacterized protein n=1 Tax=Streptomyces lonegramiae TaxID=3075524 RepID=A0ABU2XKU4_9ACTN|nr:hypothetical protein [Streptomyces sp. DSM 41529]MDT0546462.1 hypothetical protein [Streptomyces sp. DSM 41529]
MTEPYRSTPSQAEGERENEVPAEAMHPDVPVTTPSQAEGEREEEEETEEETKE